MNWAARNTDISAGPASKVINASNGIAISPVSEPSRENPAPAQIHLKLALFHAREVSPPETREDVTCVIRSKVMPNWHIAQVGYY